MAGRRIEMQELAQDLGVSRATLFRWVGGRDQLLAEIIWSMTLPTFEAAVQTSRRKRGANRVASVLGDLAAFTVSSEPMMTFVQREPERALRLLTTQATDFQARLQALIEALLAEEIAAGRIDPPLPVHDLAYLTLRMSEAFVYSDVIAGETPDPGKVRQAVRALLRG
ncbi:QsdR family transcriptional regulator [Nocardioides albidus]|nr:QsdR family transcriptional regulator [Nocardioides albidus]